VRVSRRFDRELDDLRTLAGSSDEQAVRRLRDTQWVPLDALSQLVDEMFAAAALERAWAKASRANSTRPCAGWMPSAHKVAAAHQPGVPDWEEAVALFTRRTRHRARA
jgi:hypothetical protein